MKKKGKFIHTKQTIEDAIKTSLFIPPEERDPTISYQDYNQARKAIEKVEEDYHKDKEK